ncbi:MAG TPA: carbonic anhydrase family protein [Saprospiraceae bacterium]|nr:carbonic anhydrase family protein [Saprospiraceae bacterium]
MKTLTKEIQSKITPQDAIRLLKNGNKRFVDNLKVNRNLLQQVNETSDGQFPLAIILSCIDSRTSAELIFDQGLGDIFSCRIAGNVLNKDILGSMEFACKVARSKVIVVLGHSKCGAVKGACDGVQLGNLTALLDKIKPAIEAENTITENRNASNSDFVEKVAELNVHLTMQEIVKRSRVIAEMLNSGEIAIIGGMYDVETGVVEFYEDEIMTGDNFDIEEFEG